MYLFRLPDRRSIGDHDGGRNRRLSAAVESTEVSTFTGFVTCVHMCARTCAYVFIYIITSVLYGLKQIFEIIENFSNRVVRPHFRGVPAWRPRIRMVGASSITTGSPGGWIKVKGDRAWKPPPSHAQIFFLVCTGFHLTSHINIVLYQSVRIAYDGYGRI